MRDLKKRLLSIVSAAAMAITMLPTLPFSLFASAETTTQEVYAVVDGNLNSDCMYFDGSSSSNARVDDDFMNVNGSGLMAVGIPFTVDDINASTTYDIAIYARGQGDPKVRVWDENGTNLGSGALTSGEWSGLKDTPVTISLSGSAFSSTGTYYAGVKANEYINLYKIVVTKTTTETEDSSSQAEESSSEAESSSQSDTPVTYPQEVYAIVGDSVASTTVKISGNDCSKDNDFLNGGSGSGAAYGIEFQADDTSEDTTYTVEVYAQGQGSATAVVWNGSKTEAETQSLTEQNWSALKTTPTTFTLKGSELSMGTNYAGIKANEYINLYKIVVTKTGATEENYEIVGPYKAGTVSKSGSELTATSSSTRDYKFVGWYSDAECKTQLSTDSTYTPADDAKVYAKFDYVSYNMPIIDIVTSKNNGSYMEAFPEDCSKSTKYKDSKVTIANADGYELPKVDETDDAGNVTGQRDMTVTIKGRGNSTWNLEKRPFQLSFESKVNLFNNGQAANKKWLLIANHIDRSLLRNQITYDWARTSLDGIPFTTSTKPVEFYLNGEYMGVYLMVEQSEAAKGRVTATDPTEATSDITQIGFLAELDNLAESNGTPQEDYYVKVKNLNQYFTLKSGVYTETTNEAGDPTDVTTSGGNNTNTTAIAIGNYLDTVSDAIYSGDKTKIESLVDINSAVDMFILQEFTKNCDAGGSSFYMSKDQGADAKLVFNPPWDFDKGFGNDTRNESATGLYSASESNDNVNMWFVKLWAQDWFKELVKARWSELRSNAATDPKATTIANIDQYSTNYSDSLTRQFDKWNTILTKTYQWNGGGYEQYYGDIGTSVTGNTYDKQVTYLKNWITDRVAFMDEAFDYSDEPVTGETLTLNASDYSAYTYEDNGTNVAIPFVVNSTASDITVKIPVTNAGSDTWANVFGPSGAGITWSSSDTNGDESASGVTKTFDAVQKYYNRVSGEVTITIPAGAPTGTYYIGVTRGDLASITANFANSGDVTAISTGDDSSSQAEDSSSQAEDSSSQAEDSSSEAEVTYPQEVYAIVDDSIASTTVKISGNDCSKDNDFLNGGDGSGAAYGIEFQVDDTSENTIYTVEVYAQGQGSATAVVWNGSKTEVKTKSLTESNWDALKTTPTTFTLKGSELSMGTNYAGIKANEYINLYKIVVTKSTAFTVPAVVGGIVRADSLTGTILSGGDITTATTLYAKARGGYQCKGWTLTMSDGTTQTVAGTITTDEDGNDDDNILDLSAYENVTSVTPIFKIKSNILVLEAEDYVEMLSESGNGGLEPWAINWDLTPTVTDGDNIAQPDVDDRQKQVMFSGNGDTHQATVLHGPSKATAIPFTMPTGNEATEIYIGYNYGQLSDTKYKDDNHDCGLWVNLYIPKKDSDGNDISSQAQAALSAILAEGQWRGDMDNALKAPVNGFDKDDYYVLYQHLKNRDIQEATANIPANVGLGSNATFYISVASDQDIYNSEYSNVGSDNDNGYFDYIMVKQSDKEHEAIFTCDFIFGDIFANSLSTQSVTETVIYKDSEGAPPAPFYSPSVPKYLSVQGYTFEKMELLSIEGGQTIHHGSDVVTIDQLNNALKAGINDVNKTCDILKDYTFEAGAKVKFYVTQKPAYTEYSMSVQGGSAYLLADGATKSNPSQPSDFTSLVESDRISAQRYTEFALKADSTKIDSFKYWTLNGMIYSYDPEIVCILWAPSDFVAVYDESAVAETDTPVAYIDPDVRTIGFENADDNNQHKITFFCAFTPDKGADDCTIIERGIVYSGEPAKSSLAALTSGEGNVTKPAKCGKLVVHTGADDYDLSGKGNTNLIDNQIMLSLYKTATGVNRYARAYIVYTKNGTTYVAYSSHIAYIKAAGTEEQTTGSVAASELG